MLKLIIGPAGTGKTGAIYKEIKEAVDQKKGGRFLIVPEQFSHEAERELCGICGDTLSRYAEVLSFTGLARAVEAELGGGAVPVLDKSGRLLCMTLAADRCNGALKIFGPSLRRPEMQSVLLSVLDTMRTSCVTSDMLLNAAEETGGELAMKLQDIALIYESYRRILEQSHADPADALQTLAAQLPDSQRIGSGSVFYIDGFTDFTALELNVLEELLRKEVTLNVCLTVDSLTDGRELFTLQRDSAVKLLRMAEQLGQETEVTDQSGSGPESGPELNTGDTKRSAAPLFLADNVFSVTGETMDAEGAVVPVQAANMTEECRAAAAEVLTLTRDKKYRRRDIAIAVRGFEDYAPLLECTFEEYGIPLYTARRTPMSVRPLPLMIACAYEILSSGWRPDDVISYMGSGLSGLDPEECDLLSEYVFRWQPGPGDWHRDTPWSQHPDGYGKELTDADRLRLEEINRLRDRLAAPLLALERASKTAATASGQASALADFLIQTGVPAVLDRRAERLVSLGRNTEAEEYTQIWDIAVSALEQTHRILGGMTMDRDRFSALFLHILSSYDIGSIPVSLDCVTAGDPGRMRRRNLKCLLVLGASSDRLPAFPSGSALFSDDELMQLDRAGACIGESPENGVLREHALLCGCLSLPSDLLWISCPLTGPDGSPVKSSVVIDRAEQLFGISVQPCSPEDYRTAAPLPALRAAVGSRDGTMAALTDCLEKICPEELAEIRRASAVSRGRLSPDAVEMLYGRTPVLNASRADKYFSCPYDFFTRYGLRVRPFKKAVFESSDIGTFTHYILEHTLKDLASENGFRDVREERVAELTEKYIRKYEAEELEGLAEKSPRFVYLLRRAEQDLLPAVMDSVRELSRSDFIPVGFEVNLSELSACLPLPASADGTVSAPVHINGFIDRVDAWIRDNTAWLRIADYKTGGGDFDLTDIWYGMKMQLVLYLCALCLGGKKTAEYLGLPADRLRPAGMNYIPVFRKYLSTEGEEDEGKAAEEHGRQLRRKGIVFAAGGVPEAWEKDGGTEYSPLGYSKDGSPKGDAAVTEEKLDLLFRHAACRLRDMAEGISSGRIDARPVRRSGGRTPCDRCDMRGSCGFIEGENGESCHDIEKMKPEDVWNCMKEEVENNA